MRVFGRVSRCMCVLYRRDGKSVAEAVTVVAIVNGCCAGGNTNLFVGMFVGCGENEAPNSAALCAPNWRLNWGGPLCSQGR